MIKASIFPIRWPVVAMIISLYVGFGFISLSPDNVTSLEYSRSS